MASNTIPESTKATSPGFFQSIVNFHREGVITLTNTFSFVHHLGIKEGADEDGILTKITKIFIFAILFLPLCAGKFLASSFYDVINFCSRTTAEQELSQYAEMELEAQKTSSLAAQQLTGEKADLSPSLNSMQRSARAVSSDSTNGTYEHINTPESGEMIDSMQSSTEDLTTVIGVRSFATPPTTNSILTARGPDGKFLVPTDHIIDALLEQVDASGSLKVNATESLLTTASAAVALGGPTSKSLAFKK